MRFSFNWLKKYLSTDLDIARIAECATSIGLEVEEVIDPSEIFKNFKLVKIQSAEKHPNADRLKVCSVVDAHGEPMQIVCGAPNAREGLVAVLALPGAVIPESNEILKKSKIRGVESQGMMCSAAELNLETANCPEHGIIEISPDIPLTTGVGEALGFDGGILNISVTPNRGDCFSVKGIARDLAAAGAGKFHPALCEPVQSEFDFPLKITHDHSAAFRQYVHQMSFRIIRGVKNQESPTWLKNALHNAGMNSISALVDIANYYMVDSGAPLQIYDLDKIEGDMNIRFAERNEKFTDFNGKQYSLRHDMLISEDSRQTPFCLLGIKSGKQIMCDENTKNVLVEAAVFDPVFIAKTGSFLGVTSDSRTRFERGVDKNSCATSIEEVARLIKDICGGSVGTIFSIGEREANLMRAKLSKEKLRNISGCEIDWEKVKVILKKLGLRIVSETESAAEFSVPSWRYDLAIEEDLIEEVLRINGYENIQEKPLKISSIAEDPLIHDMNQTIKLKKLLASRKMSEVVEYSFTKREYAEAFKEDSKLICIINSISSDFEVMRPSLLPNLLKTSIRSLNYGEDSISIFEVGNVFTNSCEQATHISGLRAGNANSRNWLNKKRTFDVFDVKKDFFAILDFYGISSKNVTIGTKTPSYYHPSRSGSVYFGKKLLGYFGELHPKINKLFGISERVVCFEVLPSVSEIKKVKSREYCGKVFPKIERDFSFLFNEKDAVGEIVSGIYRLDPKITKVDIFDSFSVSSTQKSIGITIILDAINRTLTEEEAAAVSNKIINYVEKSGGKLRGK